ncbi:MAG: hypothetical protein PVG97_03265 [Syntrophobacterales bacterium]|jgi:hypothetical protein
MIKPLVKYRILNMLEKRHPLSLSCTKDEVCAEFETAFDADLTYRNLIAKVPDVETLLNTDTNTIEVSLCKKCDSPCEAELPLSRKGLHDGQKRVIEKVGKSDERKIKDKTSLSRFDSGGMFGINERLLVAKHCSCGDS